MQNMVYVYEGIKYNKPYKKTILKYNGIIFNAK